jgi:poly(A) polymerase
VLKVLYRLHHQGYEAYLVGGGVRDLLLGRTPKDFDIATDAHPGEIRRLFRNSRIIGKRFRLVQVFFRGGKIVEVSTFRRRSEFEDANDILAPNNTFGTPAEDALRRDLTINALFYNIADFSVIDYVGGLDDLHQGLIRVVGEPAVRFRRDPVRMLRAVRHAARTGFRIDPETWEAIRELTGLIRMCAPSRLRDELLKDFKSGSAAPFFALLQQSGLLYAIFPAWEQAAQAAGDGAALTRRVHDLLTGLDTLVQAGQPPSEAFFWAVLVLPYLERGPGPKESDGPPADDREALLGLLAGLEFPRRLLDDVGLLLATAGSYAYYREANRRLPVRLQRRSCFVEARLLYALQNDLLDSTLADLEAAPPPAPRPKAPPRKRRRRRRPKPSPKS